MNNNELKDISDNLLNLLFQIHNRLFNPSEMVKGVSIPPSHMKVIFYLSRKKSMSVSDVAKCLDISKPNMTPIIDKLINEGFVYRYTDPNDRRKINIELTEKAHLFLKNKELEIKNSLLTKISTLDDEDLHKLNITIKDMYDILIKLKK
ncbi:MULTISPECIES: MarR family transcriptional regulator [unclassified Clostridium]|uniref:MarR family winged helix-turn-helix transcriptional regulator n=1 Tax=unclassified Clostridium TaxID=2614128 RepID=UPI00189BC17B|nr:MULTISPECIES: MarR family transcriptional regulator [unclassified Clostridium]MCR1952659.1 MarR family transcriptional regulator [Clostridium sp. DSM 100503]